VAVPRIARLIGLPAPTGQVVVPRNEAQGGTTVRKIVFVVMLLVVGFAGAGCSETSTEKDGARTGAGTAVNEAAARPILVTREWGVVDGMLSVVVANTSDRTLRSAEGVITARDRNNVLIATSLESPDSGCCDVVDLPPGQQFGFYIDVGDSATDVSRVNVAYRNVSWTPAGEEPAGPLVARPVRLDGNGRGAVVVADVRSPAPMVAEASVQAFLTGPDGEFLAVVAGHWYCLSAGRHEIQMQLRHPVPAGTPIDRVLVHPIPNDHGGTAPKCAGHVETG
jgi:hypothetical protein